MSLFLQNSIAIRKGMKTAFNSCPQDMPLDFMDVCPWCACVEKSGENKHVNNWRCGHSAKKGMIYISVDEAVEDHKDYAKNK